MHSVNLLEWIDRLGFRRRDRPEYIYGVQPTTLLRDESAIVPPVPGVEGIAGSFNLAAAGTFAGWRLQNRGPGWTACRILMNSNVTWNIRIGAAAGAGAVTGLTVTSLGVGTPASTVVEVDFTAAPVGTIYAGQTSGMFEEEILVPPGQVLEVGQTTATQAATCNLRFIELPAEMTA